ncbi:MAG: hypothetical protein ACTHMS_11395 [Jatrophihabitans sp.]|uniref:hypothetical protein n=1 Tax=Jatrophihabitans sp. TaxID=1932789 RepID=UPI003F81E96C
MHQAYAVLTLGDDLHPQLVEYLLDVPQDTTITLFEGGAVLSGGIDPSTMRIVTVDAWALAVRFEQPHDLPLRDLVAVIQDHITEGMVEALSVLGAEDWPVVPLADGGDAFELRVPYFETLRATTIELRTV